MSNTASTTDSILEFMSFRLNRLCEMTKSSASGFYEREFGIGLRELRVLRFAGLEPGLTLTRLIELVLLEKTVTSKLVTALAKRGLLRREVGEADARQLNLYLTAAGEALVAQTYQRFDARDLLGADVDLGLEGAAEALFQDRLPQRLLDLHPRQRLALHAGVEKRRGALAGVLDPIHRDVGVLAQHFVAAAMFGI